MEIQQNEKDKKSKTYLMILIGALLALNIGIGINLYMGNKKNKELTVSNENLVKDKNVLEKEVKDLETELESLRTENQSLTTQLNEKDLAIEQKIRQIKNLLAKGKLSESEYKKAKQEILNLKAQIEDYKSQIAMLTKENEKLTSDVNNLNNDLTVERAKGEEQSRIIDQKNQTISKAQRLQAGSIVVAGVRERKLFGKKEVTTEKASKVEEIKVRFVIDKNVVANSGEKDIFVKIIGPDGAPITGKMQTTKVDGTETLYTEKKTIEYNNDKVEDVVYCKKQGDYAKGEYTVELFTEGYRLGTTKFTLK